ncbi:hypothetical protein C8Q78DRAFT_994509 [Trametes maxima]|nr:hypothetical protein C8Q78DRAFT_994509 [Trametes maxima]
MTSIPMLALSALLLGQIIMHYTSLDPELNALSYGNNTSLHPVTPRPLTARPTSCEMPDQIDVFLDAQVSHAGALGSFEKSASPYANLYNHLMIVYAVLVFHDLLPQICRGSHARGDAYTAAARKTTAVVRLEKLPGFKPLRCSAPTQTRSNRLLAHVAGRTLEPENSHTAAALTVPLLMYATLISGLFVILHEVRAHPHAHSQHTANACYVTVV